MTRIEERPTAPAVDPITFSVILSRLASIATEMTITLENAAMTSILALVRDYSCVVYDARGRQVAMVDALPIHTNSMNLVLEEIVRFMDGDIAEGDVIACNDPYHGNTHVGDLVTVCPVFYEGRHLFWTAAKGHQLDVGCYLPHSVNPFARDVFQEGLTIPPLKLYDAGVRQRDVIELYLANVRWRDLLEGDLMAMLGSVWTGARRLQELCARYGPETVELYLEEAIAYAAQRTAAEIRAMADGTYSGEAWLDSTADGERNLPIRCTVTIAGETVDVDFAGSAAQASTATNASYAVMKAAGGIPIAMAIDPDIPHNEGCISRIAVSAPPGTICNAEYPAATAASTVLPSDVMQEAVVKAFAQAVPEKAYAAHARWSNVPMLSGVDRRTGVSWGHQVGNGGGGGGAAMGADGWPLITTSAGHGGLKTASVEHTELLYPLLFEQWEVEPDSMGLGRYIGGPGIRCTFRPVAGPAETICLSDGLRNPPCGVLVHGSTVATNTIIQRNGPKVGLVCTRGFRDALYFRDGFKWDRFNPRLPRPPDFVDRYLRLGVDERVDREGRVLRPLDERSVREAAAIFREQGVEAVAVALLWAHANPVHERRVCELLAEELPSAPAMLSSEILPEIGEWVRTSATVLSAYVYPGTAAYLRRLERWLAESGLGVACDAALRTRGLRPCVRLSWPTGSPKSRPTLPGGACRRRPSEPNNRHAESATTPEATPLLVMQVNGGCARVEQSLRVPVNLIASGPAAAPAAAMHLGRRLAARDIITVDMGGTSFDVCLIAGGEVPRSRTIMIEHQPIGVPGVEIHSIGAGGGSIAWIDSGGALRVGPQSAGARPGPAAYGRGGTQPTVTDANVVLGYLSPLEFLGGRRVLRAEASEQAIETHVAGPLGIDVVEAAAGIIRVVDENMVDAIRVVSVERGIDPRPFLLVAGGGAGPLHSGRLAAELGIERVLVPSEAGTLSAFGMTVTDVRHDYSGTLHTTSSAPALDAVNELLQGLEARALAELEAAGFARERVHLHRFVDARYAGQVHELITPVPGGPLDEAAFAAIAEGFHELHTQRYTYSLPQSPVECLHWRVSGIGPIERRAEPGFDAIGPVSAEPARTGSRAAYFEELGGFVETATYASAKLAAGAALTGPAVVDGATTTVVVFPGQRLLADGRGSFLIEIPYEEPGAARPREPAATERSR